MVSTVEIPFTSPLPIEEIARKIEKTGDVKVYDVDVVRGQEIAGKTGSKLKFRLLGSTLPKSWRWIPTTFEIRRTGASPAYNIRVALDLGTAMFDGLPTKNRSVLQQLADKILAEIGD